MRKFSMIFLNLCRKKKKKTSWAANVAVNWVFFFFTVASHNKDVFRLSCTQWKEKQMKVDVAEQHCIDFECLCRIKVWEYVSYIFCHSCSFSHHSYCKLFSFGLGDAIVRLRMLNRALQTYSLPLNFFTFSHIKTGIFNVFWWDFIGQTNAKECMVEKWKENDTFF